MTDLTGFARLAAREHGLCVVSTVRQDGTIGSSVVNAGVMDHPLTGAPVVTFVSRGNAWRLPRLRARPQATVVARAGWEWAAAEGPAEPAGPDDPLGGMDAERIRLLLREIFTACGGTHDDWDTYDQVMAAERRTAVLLVERREPAWIRGVDHKAVPLSGHRRSMPADRRPGPSDPVTSSDLAPIACQTRTAESRWRCRPFRTFTGRTPGRSSR